MSATDAGLSTEQIEERTGRYVSLSWIDGGFTRLVAECWAELKSHHKRYVERGIDAQIETESIEGDEVIFAVSRVEMMGLVTTETRANYRQLREFFKAEDPAASD